VLSGSVALSKYFEPSEVMVMAFSLSTITEVESFVVELLLALALFAVLLLALPFVVGEEQAEESISNSAEMMTARR